MPNVEPVETTSPQESLPAGRIIKKFRTTLLVILVIVFISLFGRRCIRELDRVVILDESVNQSWAQVENQLQRRHDLIPNLVAVVKGYMKHEKDVLTQIAALRTQWAQSKGVSEKIKNAQATSGALSRLMVAMESYPQLKANANCVALQDQLEGTENRIAVERLRYNKDVQEFNTYQRTIFGGVFTGLRGLDDPRIYFKAEVEARKVIKVEL